MVCEIHTSSLDQQHSFRRHPDVLPPSLPASNLTRSWPISRSDILRKKEVKPAWPVCSSLQGSHTLGT